MPEVTRFQSILQHYEMNFENKANVVLFKRGPIEKLPPDFKVLEFPPNKKRNMWTYATCGMSLSGVEIPIELYILSSIRSERIVEILVAIACYHNSVNNLNLHHTVNFGISWQGSSACTYGLISLPYLDGPNLENLILANEQIKFYWLIPITESEVVFKSSHGVDALEELFDKGHFNYVDPGRKSVI